MSELGRDPGQGADECAGKTAGADDARLAAAERAGAERVAAEHADVEHADAGQAEAGDADVEQAEAGDADVEQAEAGDADVEQAEAGDAAVEHADVERNVGEHAAAAEPADADADAAAEPADAARVTAASRADRAYLLAVARRILADPAEAEDVVQDAFARLATQDVAAIRDLRGWLVVAVRRLALDRIGSAHRRLSAPQDPTAWDFGVAGSPGPGPASSPDPADRVTLDDEIRGALSVVLDRLTAGERAAFLLHDVFGIPFESVAETVGRTPAACRQLASRARRAIRASGPTTASAPSPTAPPGPRADPQLQRVTDAFIAACAGGDLGALVRILHPEVSGWATLRGVRVGFDVGAERVAAGSLRYLGPTSGWTLAPLLLDDGMALVATHDGAPVALIRVLVADGLITAIRTVLLP